MLLHQKFIYCYFTVTSKAQFIWFTFPVRCISESSIKIKISVNFYFHISLFPWPRPRKITPLHNTTIFQNQNFMTFPRKYFSEIFITLSFWREVYTVRFLYHFGGRYILWDFCISPCWTSCLLYLDWQISFRNQL